MYARCESTFSESDRIETITSLSAGGAPRPATSDMYPRRKLLLMRFIIKKVVVPLVTFQHGHDRLLLLERIHLVSHVLLPCVYSSAYNKYTKTTFQWCSSLTLLQRNALERPDMLQRNSSGCSSDDDPVCSAACFTCPPPVYAIVQDRNDLQVNWELVLVSFMRIMVAGIAIGRLTTAPN
jgi:hypothetical protein